MTKKYYLGIDIGGSYIKAALVSDAKRIFFERVPTPKNRREFETQLKSFMTKVSRVSKPVGIGVALAGIVDTKKGTLIKAPNMKFMDGWNAKKFFSQFRVSVKIENDARCFLLAEAKEGAGKNKRNLIGVVIGTGIGGAIMENGKLKHGAHGSAGEFGHMLLNSNKSWEEVAGWKGFKKLGDRSDIVGMGVADIINAFDPEMVILGGGGVYAKHFNLAKTKRFAKKFIVSPIAKKTPIVKGKLGESAQAIGAALLFSKG